MAIKEFWGFEATSFVDILTRKCSSKIFFKVKLRLVIGIKTKVSAKGPSLYYVGIFLDFFWPSHPNVSIKSTEPQQKLPFF